jgi:anti-anti-sigma factor
MEIERQITARTATLTVRGRLDAAWSESLGTALQQAVRDGFHDVHLNLAGVVFLSSAGIRVLMTHWRELRKAQGRMVVLAASNEVEKTLKLAGLQALLNTSTAKSVEPAKSVAPPPPRTRPWSGQGFAGEVEEISAGARWRGRFPGLAPTADAPVNLSALAAAPLENTPLPATTLALGFGAFGQTDAATPATLGELLAAAGVAVCLPADGANQPDYLIAEAALAPEAYLAQGLVAQGAFSHLARFEAARETRDTAWSDLAVELLKAAGAPVVAFAAVVEAAALVGACLRRAPGATGCGQAFDFPAVRDWLTFTAEPAYQNTVALLVGVIAEGKTSGPVGAFTRPLGANGAPSGHVHAAAFPYRPVRQGRIDLAETAASLFDTGRVLGVLHLLSDLRPSAGAGESRFFRGAIWFGPLEV